MSWSTPNYAVPGLMPTTSPKYEASTFVQIPPIILVPYILGEIWDGIASVGPVLINGLQPVHALSSVRMVLYWSYKKSAAVVFSTNPSDGQGEITISDAFTWELTVEPTQAEIMNLHPGTWLWDMYATDTAGHEITLYKGTLDVLEPRL